MCVAGGIAYAADSGGGGDGGGGGGRCLISAAADGSRLVVKMPVILLLLGFFFIGIEIKKVRDERKDKGKRLKVKGQRLGGWEVESEI